MKIYVVIDTNVLISGMLKSDSAPGEVIKAIFNDKILPLVNDEIILEYFDVISRNKFNFGTSIIEETMLPLIAKSMFVNKTKADEIFTDKDDVVFYEVALTGKLLNETYLVTGNSKHFPKKPFVVTPSEMIDIIAKNQL